MVSSIAAERDELMAWLRGRGLAVAESDTNFVLFGTFDDRRAIWQGLLDRGVLIREVGPPQWLRVTIGTPHEMAAFRATLDEVLSCRSAAPPPSPRAAGPGPAVPGPAGPAA